MADVLITLRVMHTLTAEREEHEKPQSISRRHADGNSGLGDDRRLFRPPLGRGLVGRLQEQGHGGGLFPRRAELELVDRGGLDLRLEHRLRARRRPGRLGGQGRRGHGPLRTACLVPAAAGLGLRALLRPLAGLHHAGVPGTAVLDELALRALDRLADHLRGLEDRRGHLCRRNRLLRALARRQPAPRRPCLRQLLDRLDPRDPHDGAVYGSGRHAGRGLQRCHPDGRADLRVGHFDDLRPAAVERLAGTGRRLAQSPRGLRFGHVQPLETAHPQGRGRDLGAGPGHRLGGQRGARGVVLQRPFPLAGHADLRR